MILLGFGAVSVVVLGVGIGGWVSVAVCGGMCYRWRRSGMVGFVGGWWGFWRGLGVGGGVGWLPPAPSVSTPKTHTKNITH